MTVINKFSLSFHTGSTEPALCTPILLRARHVLEVLKLDHLEVELKIGFQSKWLNKQELLQLVTSQYVPVVFYGAPLWIGSITAESWKRINAAHYRAIRGALRL